MPHRTEKLVRDSEKFELAKFEIPRLFLGQGTVDAQETFVRDSLPGNKSPLIIWLIKVMFS